MMYHNVHSLGNNRNVIKFVQIINNLFLSGCCFNSNKTPALGLDVFQEYTFHTNTFQVGMKSRHKERDGQNCNIKLLTILNVSYF